MGRAIPVGGRFGRLGLRGSVPVVWALDDGLPAWPAIRKSSAKAGLQLFNLDQLGS